MNKENKDFVYIVDDDEAVRDSLRWLLEGNGFSVTLEKVGHVPR